MVMPSTAIKNVMRSNRINTDAAEIRDLLGDMVLVRTVMIIASQVGDNLIVEFRGPSANHNSFSVDLWKGIVSRLRKYLETTRASLSAVDADFLPAKGIEALLEQIRTSLYSCASDRIIMQIESYLAKPHSGRGNALSSLPDNKNPESDAIDGIRTPTQKESAKTRSATEIDQPPTPFVEVAASATDKQKHAQLLPGRKLSLETVAPPSWWPKNESTRARWRVLYHQIKAEIGKGMNINELSTRYKLNRKTVSHIIDWGEHNTE